MSTRTAGQVAWMIAVVYRQSLSRADLRRHHVEGIALNYGWHVKYEVHTGLAVGIEGFGVVENLGNSPRWSEQEHRVGPAIFTEIELSKDLKITPDIGLLFGLTAATPDVALKLNVGVPLHHR